MMAALCEEARDKVLALSIANTQTDDSLEEIVRGAWLSDINSQQGAKELRAALTNVQRARLLRVSLAGHLIMRVYWKHWDKESRLSLLKLAGESLKDMGVKLNKFELERMIKREEKSENDKSKRSE
jgi:hypothetical protein